MSLRSRYEKLEPRERRLLTVLGAIVAAAFVLALPALLYRSLTDKRRSNVELRELIATIESSRAQIADRKAKHDALVARYARPAPPLASFIEEAAKANELAVPESQDKPEVPHGKRYTERVTVVKLHKIGMKPLAQMLEKMEKSGYPVAVTRLNVKPRSGEPDAYEIELGVSAYDRKADAASAAAPAPAAPGNEEESPL